MNQFEVVVEIPLIILQYKRSKNLNNNQIGSFSDD